MQILKQIVTVWYPKFKKYRILSTGEVPGIKIITKINHSTLKHVENVDYSGCNCNLSMWL